MPGPVGKRTTERHGHRTQAEQAVDTARGASAVEWPEPEPHWHALAVRWYLAQQESGQATYFEPSDVAAHCLVAEAMTRNLDGEKFSAMLLAQVWSSMGDLLTTEGSRRRLRIELEKPQPEDEVQKGAVASLSAARQRFGAKAK
jgi:hypothetical protein